MTKVRWANITQLLNSVARFSKVPVPVGGTRLCAGHLGTGIVAELTRKEDGWDIVIRKPVQP